jgi:LPXTG-motif cell wall-anchored protein
VKQVEYVLIILALALTVWGISAYITGGEMTLALLFIGFFIFLVAFLVYIYKK